MIHRASSSADTVTPALAALRQRGVERIDAGIIMGSGLSSVAEAIGLAKVADYGDVEGWPEARVAGHAGALYGGRVGDGEDGPYVLAACGRIHLYEGRGCAPVFHLPRLFAALGARQQVLTASVGGIRPEMEPGDMVVLTDHMDTWWHRATAELVEEAAGITNGDEAGDASTGAGWPLRCYDPALAGRLLECARRQQARVHSGVYAFCGGPQYETVAEIRILGRWACDVVGMSVVPEAVAGTLLGLHNAGLAVVTNPATGLATQKHSHEEVTRQAQAATERVGMVLREYFGG